MINKHTIMRHQIVPNPKQELNQYIDDQIRLSKKTGALYLSNLALTSFPTKVLQQTNIKIIDLSHNNIEYLPEEIKNFTKLEQLFLNNNPLQYLPIEISQCKKLKVLNLADTFVKYLPREMSVLKHLFMLDMTNCPIQGKLKDAYDMGIVYIFKYLQRKTDRAVYRELIVKKLKEWMYMGNTYEEIQEVMQRVMDNLKDVETVNLKRLLRNMTNIFPLKIEDVDAELVREKLFHSFVKSNLIDTNQQKEQEIEEELRRQAEEMEQQRLQEEAEELERQRIAEEEELQKQKELEEQQELERQKEEEEAAKNQKKGKKPAKK